MYSKKKKKKPKDIDYQDVTCWTWKHLDLDQLCAESLWTLKVEERELSYMNVPFINRKKQTNPKDTISYLIWHQKWVLKPWTSLFEIIWDESTQTYKVKFLCWMDERSTHTWYFPSLSLPECGLVWTSNKWGNLTARYRWTSWVREITDWSSNTSGGSPIMFEECVEYTLT